ncbi:unnamed protein product [Bursaphelenchus xylophilus]|uniref:(pine wood nematode) hypothetical protein n=1 Tax=Bursaphelenchus xylophilus TaxID=6326 RepID=A0A1I7RPC2_BURXY|nr:unnamed protein product [Bursaphelenchus xylophilus]CAG9095772.1 unnamed protein product [Bursaphelenchus xylophilus]
MNSSVLRVLYAGGLPGINTNCTGFPVLTPRKSCQFPGLHVEIIKRIADVLNMTIEPYYHEGELPVVGSIIDGKITGLMGYIHNGSVDTIALMVGQSEERRKYFEFTDPLYYSLGKVFINMPENTWDKYFAYFQSYQCNSWFAIGVALILQCLLTVLVHKVEGELKQEAVRCTISESVWQIIRLQLLQPETLEHSSTAGKFSVVIFSLVQCTVIMGVLSSYIFSNLVRPPQPIPFKSLYEFTSLLEAGTLHLVDVSSTGPMYDMIQTSNASDLVLLRRALKQNPVRKTNSVEHALEMMDEPGAVLVRYEDEHLAFEAYKKCDIYISEALLPPSRGYLMFKKGYPRMEEVNKAIGLEYHNFRKMWLKYLRSYRGQLGCSPPGYRRIEAHYPYIGTVLMLFLTESLALLVFFLEVFVHCFYRRK